MEDSKKGILLIIISSLMFGSYGVWSKLIGDSFGNFYQGWTRALIISLVFLPIIIFQKKIVAIDKKDYKWLAVFLFFTSLTQAPIFYAFNHMDIGSATLLFFVSMLLTMYFVGIFFLREKLTTIRIISFILAGFGMYLVFSFSLVIFSLFAVFMAILNGIASGGEVSFSKKLSGNYSPLYLVWLSWIMIFITNATISLFLGEIQHVPSINLVWLYHLGYTFVSIFSFWFIIEGLRYTEASTGGLLGLLEIVFGIFFGIVIFQEQLTIKIILGALFILLAASLSHIYIIIQKMKK